MVKVKPTELKNKISVKASVETNVFSIKDNLSEFYAKQSENWAHSEGMVNGLDYSSKYYAEQSKISAENSQKIGNIIQENYNSFMDLSSSANIELQEVKGEVIDSIGASKQDAIDSIETSKQDVINDINSTKTTILNDIEFVADGEKEEIRDIIDTGKDELKETIGDVKVLTTLEIGTISFTQGYIDESKGLRRCLNKVDNIILQDRYPEFTKWLKTSVAFNPDLACTEAEWQTELTMSANGVCEKYVIDDEAGTIRLPKYPNYLDLTINTNGASAVSQTVSVYGNGKVLGLTNGASGTGAYYTTMGTVSGHSNVWIDKFYSGSTPSVGASFGNENANHTATLGVINDASRSGLTGKVTIPAVAGVTSEKIKGTYFIQVATGAETEDNIINEIELNNPFFLGMSQYFETAPNNSSWLKSEGQWNSKAVYPTVYDWALINANNGIEGFKLVTDTYTDYDYVINTADETFRLPLLDGSEDIVDYDNIVNIATPWGSGVPYKAPKNGLFRVRASSSAVGQYLDFDVDGKLIKNRISTVNNENAYELFEINRNESLTLETDFGGAKHSLDFYPYKGNGSLYFYVGETVQNANLVNIGRIQEAVASFVPNNSKSWDGQWVQAYLSLGNTTAIGEYTLDLSDHLPNDGYQYEVMFAGNATNRTTEIPSLAIKTDITGYSTICVIKGDGAGTFSNAWNIILPVGTGRTVSFKITNNAFTYCNKFVHSYRRIGTNL